MTHYDVYIKNQEHPIPVTAEDTDDVFVKLPNNINPDHITSIVPSKIEPKD